MANLDLSEALAVVYDPIRGNMLTTRSVLHGMGFRRIDGIRRPAEIGRIDIRRQPLLETVQLVRADEVHLARKRRVIAGPAQVMRECRDRRDILCGIVIDLRPARQLPGHERGAGRGAERRGRIIVGEPRRAFGQRLHMRRVQKIRRAVGKQLSIELIDHDDEDIGLLRSHRLGPSVVETWRRCAVT